MVPVVVCLWFAANKPKSDNMHRKQALVFNASLVEGASYLWSGLHFLL